MSLLNDALRKKTSKDRHETPQGFIGAKAFKANRIIISVLVIIAAAAVFWALSSRRTSVPAGPTADSATPVAAENENPVIAGSPPENTGAAVDVKPVQPAMSDDGVASDNTLKNEAGHPAEKEPVKDQTSRKAKKAAIENQNIKTMASKSGDTANKAPAKKRQPATTETKPPDNKASIETEAAQADSAAAKFYQKALQFHRDGRIKEAASMYREVLKYTPSNSNAACNLSSAYIELSDFASAYELLSSLNSSNPGSAEIQLNLAVAEIGLGRTADAMELLKGLDSEDKKLKFSKFLHLGVAESQTGKLDEALIYYKKAEEINGGVPKLLYNIAVINDKLGNYNDAAAYYQKFLAAGSSASSDTEAVNARIKVLNNFTSRTNK
jgi:tetratricopeptide (TPR) repeat protein